MVMNSMKSDLFLTKTLTNSPSGDDASLVYVMIAMRKIQEVKIELVGNGS